MTAPEVDATCHALGPVRRVFSFFPADDSQRAVHSRRPANARNTQRQRLERVTVASADLTLYKKKSIVKNKKKQSKRKDSTETNLT